MLAMAAMACSRKPAMTACLSPSSFGALAISLPKPSRRLSRTHWRRALSWPHWAWFHMPTIMLLG